MTRRVAAGVLILGVLGLLVALDAADDDEGADEAVATVLDGGIPAQNSVTALASTWFCAGGTADEERFADHVIVLANEHGTETTVEVTVYSGVVVAPTDASIADAAADPDAPAAGDDDEDAGGGDVDAASLAPPTREIVTVPPRETLRLRLGDIVDAPIASALVEADRGGLAVEHTISSIHGADTKPCVTEGAAEWHFAHGRTSRDARELLVLFNPYPDPAIVDGFFSTDTGTREPLRFDGLVVPANSTLAVDLGDDVTRRDEVATSLRLRSGRVVVDRIVRRNGDEGARGLTLASGNRPGTTWVFVDGFVDDTTTETYVVYNPTDRTLEAEIELIVDNPERNGVPERIGVTLPPQSHEVIDLGAGGLVPPDVGHAAIASSLNGVGFVVERVLESTGQTRRGISVVSGSPVVANNWVLAGGEASDVIDEWLYVLNPNPSAIARVDVFTVAGGQLVPVDGLQGFEISPRSRLARSLNEFTRGERTVVIRSSEPVVVERGLYSVDPETRVWSNALGIPYADDAVPLPDYEDPDFDQTTESTTATTDDIPVPPSDVTLPDPDEVIEVDPDAEATTTTVTPSTVAGDVPDTVPQSTASTEPAG